MPDISGGAFWVVDPLDGAHEFIKKSGCFADGKPLLYDAKDLYTQPYIALSPALAKIQAKA